MLSIWMSLHFRCLIKTTIKLGLCNNWPSIICYNVSTTSKHISFLYFPLNVLIYSSFSTRSAIWTLLISANKKRSQVQLVTKQQNFRLVQIGSINAEDKFNVTHKLKLALGSVENIVGIG